MATENRGGRRPNQTGRPPKTLSQKRIDALLKAARKFERRLGKSPEDLLMELAYAVEAGKDATLTQQYRALDCFFRNTMPRQTESNVTVTKHTAPGVLLPAEDRDPAELAPAQDEDSAGAIH